MLQRILLLASLTLCFAFLLFAQKRDGGQLSLPATSPTSGSQMFHAYCADCHGHDAKGNGPLVAVLKVVPPDLTTLAQRNQGKFPVEQVSRIIRGPSGNAAHGSREMPIWGPVFRNMDKGHKGGAEVRIKTLTSYIASLQVR